MASENLDEVARIALLEHAKERKLAVSVSPENVVTFGVGNLACKCQFVKGSQYMAQVEFTVWIDAARTNACIDQYSAMGENPIQMVANAVHAWCEGHLPVWLAVFNGKDVEGLATDFSFTSFDEKTKESHKWDCYAGKAQTFGMCRSVPERLQQNPPYKLVIPEMLRLQVQGYCAQNPGVHCLKLFYGRGGDNEPTPESKLDGDHWDGANECMHAQKWATESTGVYWVKQFIVMVPPHGAASELCLARQASTSMLSESGGVPEPHETSITLLPQVPMQLFSAGELSSLARGVPASGTAPDAPASSSTPAAPTAAAAKALSAPAPNQIKPDKASVGSTILVGVGIIVFIVCALAILALAYFSVMQHF